MALTKTRPAAEDMTDTEGDTAVAERPQAPALDIPETAAPAAPVVAAAPAATALAVAAPARRFMRALEECENVIAPGDVKYNTFPTITVSLAGFKQDKTKDIGPIIGLSVMSYNVRWVASPGETGAEATKATRYSLDGKTMEGTGEDIMAYVQHLIKVEGYTKAKLKKYLSIYGELTFTSNKKEEINQIAPENWEIVHIQVPPESLEMFNRFQITEGVKQAKGLVPATNLLTLRCEEKAGTNQNYANIVFTRG